MNSSSPIRRILPTLGVASLICGLLVVGGLAVYTGGGTRTVLPHLLYVPVVIAALVFGAWGGIAAGVAAGLMLGPWMPLDVDFGVPQTTAGWLFRLGFFVAIGGITGAGRRLIERRGMQLQATQAALRKTEASFHALVEAVDDYAIITLDHAGRVLTWNRGAIRTFGYDPDEILGQHFARFYPPDDQLPALELGVAAREGRSEDEGWRIRRDGSRFWANTIISALTDSEGNLQGFAKVTRDMTEAKRAREQLEEILRSKDELIAAVAHELRTPLTAVVGFSELLAQGRLAGDELKELAAEIHHQASDLSGIVDDLLVAARIEIGRLTIAAQPTDTASEVRAVLAAFPDSDRIQVEGSAMAWADPARLRQVLRNLISNAVRHGGREIAVRISEDEGMSLIEVVDNGQGVSDSDHERIFSPYESLGDHSGQPSSLGLGLTVSRQLARLMGGDVTYYRTDGQTVFRFSLPTGVSTERHVASQAIRGTS